MRHQRTTIATMGAMPEACASLPEQDPQGCYLRVDVHQEIIRKAKRNLAIGLVLAAGAGFVLGRIYQ